MTMVREAELQQLFRTNVFSTTEVLQNLHSPKISI